MYNIQQIFKVIRHNEEIARKLFEIERKILTIDNFKGLFEELLLLIEEKFHIPHVWISIVEDNDLSILLKALKSSELLKKRLNVVDREYLLRLFMDDRTPVLANTRLTFFHKLFPNARKFSVGSLSLSPITLYGNIIGSLNMGDPSETRFQPDMDTFFLSQLVVKISICLANVLAHEQLRHLAIRDPLTNLLNRRQMEYVLVKEFDRARRYNVPLALLFIDSDGFKKVNDRYGHECGDAVLRYLAVYLRKMIRTSDTVFRFAGDEFVIILPNHTSEGAKKVSGRLQAFFHAHPLNYGEDLIPVSISCGVASTDDGGVKDAVSLLRLADKRLYEIKRRKKGAVN